MQNPSDASLTPAAVEYAWQQLAQRMGLAQETTSRYSLAELQLELHYDALANIYEPKGIIVVPTSYQSWNGIGNLYSKSLKWLTPEKVLPSGVPTPFSEERIPILFWGKSYKDLNKPFAERLSKDTVIFYADIIAATFFMLSRLEETTAAERDQHDRFPARASVSYKQGFLDRPIIDEYALILCEWVKKLRPNWEPRPRKFTIKLSHDIDHVHLFPHWKKGARTFLGNLVKRHDLQRARESLYGIMAHLGFPNLDPYIKEIIALVNISLRYGLNNDVFYFKTSKPNTYDSGYDPNEPIIQNCIKGLQQCGFEIGLHPGYNTYDNSILLEQEKVILDRILQRTSYGARQHYLRFKIPDTWRSFELVGLTHDATLGYPEVPGFRCGTCYPFQPFDIEQNRILDIWEHPLVAMDGTLRAYQNLSLEHMTISVLRLAKRCRAVGGEFSLLWHNSFKHPKWRPSEQAYANLIEKLSRLL